MAEDEKKRMQDALKRAQAPKRPAGLGGTAVPFVEEPAKPDDGWERPERVEHTSEKEHPPGKE